MSFDSLLKSQRMKKSVPTTEEFDEILDSLQDEYRGEYVTFKFSSVSYPIIYYFAESYEGNSYELVINPSDGTVILSTLDDEGDWDTIADASYTSLEDLPNAIMEASRGWK